MLGGSRILIVEDEPIVAFDLQELVHGAGGIPLEPVHTNRAALSLLEHETADLAILDVLLADGDVSPTALELMARGVPFVVCTGGTLPRVLRLCRPDVPLVRKPIHPERLIDTLALLRSAGRARVREASHGPLVLAGALASSRGQESGRLRGAFA
jgi:CheY-like chemotaxis protein